MKLAEPLPCGATRPPVEPAGWECTGTRLMVVDIVTLDGEETPVVCPNHLIEHALNTIPGLCTPVHFNGGDHLHLRLEPRR